MIDSDPKKHMYGTDSAYHILNRWNTHRQSPLYVAAKHGHLDMVSFLISQGADPKYHSMVSKREYESILEVSVRWSHVQIVRYLLENVDWSKEEVHKSYQHVADDEDNPVLKKLLEDYSRVKFGKIYTCFRLSSLLSCLFMPNPSKVVPVSPRFGQSPNSQL